MTTPLRRIVAGVATLGRDDPALASSIRLAERTGAELHLVHVFSGEPAALGSGYAAGRGAVLRARLEAEAHALTARDRITCRVVPGRADDVLPWVAAELGADLLVLGHTRRGGTAAAVLGTTAQRVIRASTVPVLSLRAGAARAAHCRVLLASDLSPHSAHALTQGARLARALAHPAEPRLRPLYVTVPAYEALAAGFTDWSVEGAGQELDEFLEGLPELAGLDGAVCVGDPATRILDEAGEWKADLVVVGTHGRRGLPRLLLGSVAETILRRAEVSVLVIPPAPAAQRTPAPAPAAIPVVRTVPETRVAAASASSAAPVAAAAKSPVPRSVVPTHAVLAATDLSTASDHVLRSAASVAAATGATLHVIHAFDFSSPVYMGRRLDRATFQGRIAAAEAALDAQIARTVPAEVAVGMRRVEVYAAHRAIAEQAEALRAELVVVGAHTHQGSHLGVLGSTTDRLIRTLRVPCLVVRSELGVPLHRVVVPLDLSEPARAGLEIGVRWAASLGERCGDLPLPETEVAVVHVVPQLFAVADAPFDQATVPPGLNREVDAAVRAAGQPGNVMVREHVIWNDRPAGGIVSWAWRERADLLVLATHGHGPVKRGLIGGTASSVVRRAPCPVLLIPPALWRRRRRHAEPAAVAVAAA
jgi:nucleotide-binding universal stress UspA family protein